MDGSTRMTVSNGMSSSRKTLDDFFTGSGVRGAAHRLGVDEMKRRGEVVPTGAALLVTRRGAEADTATAHSAQLRLAFVSTAVRAIRPRRVASILQWTTSDTHSFR